MTKSPSITAIVEIETAIRNVSWATAQVGQKSLQTITIDFNSQKITTKPPTIGKTKIGPISLNGARNDFRLISPHFVTPAYAAFSAKGQTASGVRIVPDIDYKFNIQISLSPRLIVIAGSHDGYPSYNIAVNGKSVYDYVQGHLGQLLGDSDVTIPKKRVAWK